MSKIKKILQPQKQSAGPHPDTDILASFLDGKLDSDARRDVVEHLVACPDCYEIAQQSLGDLDAEKANVKKKLTAGKRTRRFAIAASLIFCLVVGSGLWLKVGFKPEKAGVMTASVEVDRQLRDFLLEDEDLVWTGEKADRFRQLLEQRGVELARSDTVMLASLYDPYQAKGLKKVKELLVIHVEDGVVHIKIKKMDERPEADQGKSEK